MEPPGDALERRRSFLTDGDHGHINAAAARAFQHKKREIAVSGNQPPVRGSSIRRSGHDSSYFVTPRSADSINRMSVKTSSEPERVPRIFSSAWAVLSLERSSRGKACSMDLMRSGEKPWRSRPIELTP